MWICQTDFFYDAWKVNHFEREGESVVKLAKHYEMNLNKWNEKPFAYAFCKSIDKCKQKWAFE